VVQKGTAIHEESLEHGGTSMRVGLGDALGVDSNAAGLPIAALYMRAARRVSPQGAEFYILHSLGYRAGFPDFSRRGR
jgi:hypothetical protein